MVNNVYNRLVFKHFLTVSCLLCRGPTPASLPLCRLCLAQCPVLENGCRYCSLPLTGKAADTCARCLKQPPPYDKCLSAFVYDYPVNYLIQRVKYSNQINLLPPVSKTLLEVLRYHYDGRQWPEAIIPVPLHGKRLRQRGYDQALLLSQQIQKRLKPVVRLELDSQLVRRHRSTAAQQELPAQERRSNVKGAFSLSATPEYRHLAIVDDVVTTGETVAEITRLLKKQGVVRVDVWCLARTPL